MSYEDYDYDDFRPYLCHITINHHYQDNDNYSRVREEYEVIRHFDLEDLYKELAWYKSTYDKPKPARAWEGYTSIDFGPIYKLESETEVDLTILHETSLWQEHLKKEEAKKIAQENARKEAIEKADREKELKEHELYLLLKDKFEAKR